MVILLYLFLNHSSLLVESKELNVKVVQNILDIVYLLRLGTINVLQDIQIFFFLILLRFVNQLGINLSRRCLLCSCSRVLTFLHCCCLVILILIHSLVQLLNLPQKFLYAIILILDFLFHLLEFCLIIKASNDLINV